MMHNRMNKKVMGVLFSFLLPPSSFLLFPQEAQAQRLTIQKHTVDIGRTGYEQPVTATFELRNRGLRRLVIESVKTDCGCTAVDYPKEVGINEKFTIRMTYDARQLGHFHKMAAITSNGTKEPIYLTMKGVVLADLKDYSGDYPLAFGDLLLDKNDLEYDDVSKGDHPEHVINIRNNGSSVMHPNVMHLPPYLTATVTPEVLAPGAPGIVKITLNSEKLRDYGLTQTSVYLGRELGETVGPDNEITVSTVLLPDLKDYSMVSLELAPELQFSATDVDFRSFDGKKKKTQDIVLYNTGKTTAEISSMQLFTGGIRVTLGKRELLPGETTTMRITGFAEELSQQRTRPRILMITNDPKKPKVIINIQTH